MGEEKSCLKKTSESYIIIVNVTLGLLGLTILGFGIYSWVIFGEFTPGLGEYVVLGPTILGAFLVFVAVFGITGVVFRKKCMVLVYAFLFFLLTVLMATAGGFLYSYTTELNIADLNQEITNFQGSIFESCCAPGSVATACIENQTTTLSDPCVTETTNVSDTICNILEDAEIVGTDSSDCAQGVFKDFVTEITAFLKDNLTLIAGVNIGIVVLLVLLLVASLVFVCSKDALDYGDKEETVTSSDLSGTVGTSA